MADQIEPFEIAVDDAALDDLRDRLRRTRWPERETVGDRIAAISVSRPTICRWKTRVLRIKRASGILHSRG